MPPFLAILLAFFVYWLILFVACYVIVEYGQNYLYDETTPSAGLKVALGSFVFAVLLTWTRLAFETMFTTNIAWTFVFGVVWFLVFMFVFRFHPVHAFAIGLLACLILSGASSLAVNSMTGATPASVTANRPVSKPVRTTLQTTVPAAAPAAPAAPAQPAGDAKAEPAKSAPSE